MLHHDYPERLVRVKLLVDHHVDVNLASRGSKPLIQTGCQNDRASGMVLLKAGANPREHESNGFRKVVHFLVAQGKLFEPDDEDGSALKAWIIAHGESLKAARLEEERFTSMYEAALPAPDSAAKKIRDQIISERENRRSIGY